MKEVFKDCNPTLCGNDILSGDNTYMTKTIIKEKCDCVNKSICLQIIDLLSHNHKQEALELIK